MKPKNTAAIYLRRSAIDESGEDRSINYQQEACERLAAAQGLKIVQVYNEGDGQPASIFKENERPQYDAALRALGSKYETLIAYSVDRLSRRGMTVVGQMLDTADRQGGRIVTNDGLDTNHEASRLVASFMGEMARAEVKKLSERVCAAKEQMRKGGQWTGGTPPYGLKKVSLPGESPVLAVDWEEARVIQDLVDRYLEGASTISLARWLNGQDIPTKRGRQWQPNTILVLLRKPHLVGYRHYGQDRKNYQIFCDEDENPVRVTEPIISDAKWHRLQKEISKRAVSFSKGSSSSTSLLGGLILCGQSGKQKLFHESKGSRYFCRCCENSNAVWSKDLESHVARQALLFIASLDPDSPIMEEVGRRVIAKFTPDQVDRREELEGSLAELESRVEELTTDYYRDRKIPRETFEKIESQLGIKIDTVSAELGTLPPAKADMTILMDLTQAGDSPDGDLVGEGSAWSQLEDHLKRSVMLVLVDRITVDYSPKATGRGKPSQEWRDMDFRADIDFASESNVIELSARNPKKPGSTKRQSKALTA
jgi:DNA invertase Pin-like site-specific DNA recombinase